MWMITEYCSHGDLLNFLRVHAQHFVASTMLTAEDGGGEPCYKNMAVQKSRLRRSAGLLYSLVGKAWLFQKLFRKSLKEHRCRKDITLYFRKNIADMNIRVPRVSWTAQMDYTPADFSSGVFQWQWDFLLLRISGDAANSKSRKNSDV